MPSINDLVIAIEAGDRSASDDLFQLVYEDLKQLAGRFLSTNSPGQTLQPTALVHEAYLRLMGGRDSSSSPGWADQRHFFAAAARAMRHILVDAARRKQREKRGGGMVRTSLEPDQVAEPEVADSLLALHDALDALAIARPDAAELVTLRYFGGYTIRDAAEVLGISPRTADARWAYARAWLQAEMTHSRRS
jgi:RNA polymerase sigma factor (TIGR02999 family)